MKITYENIYNISPKNPCVVRYDKVNNYGGMASMHFHPYYEIYFLISGSRKYFFKNKIFNLTHGNVIIIKPDEIHKAIQVENSQSNEYERFLVNVDVSLFSLIEKNNKSIKPLLKKGIISLNSEDLMEIIDIIKRIQREVNIKDDIYNSSVRNYIERILINLYLNDNYSISKQQVFKNDLRLQDAIDYILDNYNKQITLEECANICFMSESNFTKVFHKVVGVNFKSYINSLRIQKACELLRDSNLAISQISEIVGYDSTSYFASLFKGIMGVSPKDYRSSKPI